MTSLSAVIIAAWAWTSTLACSGKEQPKECRDLEGLTCAEVGLPDIDLYGYCDECDTLWACDLNFDGSYTMNRNDFPCKCINDEGLIEIGDTASTGCTWQL